MKLPKLMAFAGLAVASVLTLSACVSDIRVPMPEKTVTQAPQYQPGDEVDAATAERLNSDNTPYQAYEMLDGRFLVVDSSAPLPEAVTADIQARVDEVPVATTQEDSENVKMALNPVIVEVERETGHRVFIVSNLWQDVESEGGPLPLKRWVYLGGGGILQPYEFYNGNGTAEEYVEELRASAFGENFDVFVHPSGG